VHISAVQDPILVRDSPKDISGFHDSFQDFPIGPATDALGCQEPSPLAFAVGDVSAGLLKPVAAEVGKCRNTSVIQSKERVHIITAQFLTNLVSPQERRVADDAVHLGPLRFFGVSWVGEVQDGVPTLDVAGQGT